MRRLGATFVHRSSFAAPQAATGLRDLFLQRPGASWRLDGRRFSTAAPAVHAATAPAKALASNPTSHEQTTMLYNEMVRSLLVAGEAMEASNILKAMPDNDLKAPVSLYNTTIQAALTEEELSDADVEMILSLYASMKEHHININAKTLGLMLSIAPQLDDRQLTAMLQDSLDLKLDPHALGKHSRVVDSGQALRYLTVPQTLAPEHARQLRLIIDGAQTSSEGQPELSNYVLPEEAALDPLYRQQQHLETRAVSAAVSRYRRVTQSLIQMRKGANSASAHSMLLQWFQPVTAAISEEQRLISLKTAGKDRTIYGPKVLQLSAEQLSVIAMHEAMGMVLHSPSGVRFATMALQLGSAVQAEVNFSLMKGQKDAMISYLKRTGKLLTVFSVNELSKWMMDDSEWGTPMLAKVGGAILDLLMKNAKVPNPDIPEDQWETAFYHDYERDGKKRFGMIKLRDEVFDVLSEGHSLRECVNARFLPMLVPPRPWESPHRGGYLAYRNWVMRSKGSKEQRTALINSDMSTVYEALDILGGTPWRINGPVYDTIVKAWEDGGGMLDLPSRRDLVMPLPPADFTENAEARKLFLRKQRVAVQEQRDLHGLRCSFKYQLAVATEFLDKVMYFPHNLDFRGRAYPLPPHLNQMGSDLCRGLLTFGTGKALGETGLSWLKVHLCNLFGNNKISHADREKFIDDNLDAVRLSAQDPLRSGTWWQDAEDPWQALAACMEINNALKAEEGPENYVSHLPVHQDGSCNGLQHYAALGGDVEGARQVNLLPAEKPQDVYTGVAELVARMVKEDAEKGNEIALMLDGKVDRKLVKQTVMTSVYGVTFIGARKQIYNAMRNRIEIDEEQSFNVSSYITRFTFAALGEMFLGARQIQEWLGECARLVAKEGTSVKWSTPLGLPVVQPYRRVGRNAVITLVQTIILEDHNDKLPVNINRQKSAFPPNYVHSLDSTHMMVTAKKVAAQGLTFASVHDSFWTHACDVDEMGVAIRDSFVEMHSEPLLHNLLASFQREHPNVNFPPVPTRGQLDLERVKEAKYFFH